MPSRPRHPDKDLEKVLKAAEQQGWTVTKRPRGYFKIYCPCADKHLKTVHLTPGSAYLRNLLGELRRNTCWKEDQ
jgi:hypothetical protein